MYKIIDNLPIDLDFREKTNKELKLYKEWFFLNKDERLRVLFGNIHSTENYEDWNMSFESDSLVKLGEWFTQQVKTQILTKEEYKMRKKEVPDYIEIDDWDLDIKTRSLVMDIGIYFGEVFLHQYQNLRWEQYITRSKYNANHGQMVICGFGKKCLEPIRIIFNIALGFANKSEDSSALYEIYNAWESYLKVEK